MHLSPYGVMCGLAVQRVAEALIHSPFAADGRAGLIRAGLIARARDGFPGAVHWHACGRVLDQKNGNQRSNLPAQITHV